MRRKINKFLYLTPRILAIIFLLFLAIFSLDIFEPGLNAWQIVLGLFMHNIPVFILAIILWISWKYEIVGGISFILAGIAHMIFSVIRADVEPWHVSFAASLIIDVPAFLIGILFLIGWFKKKE